MKAPPFVRPSIFPRGARENAANALLYAKHLCIRTPIESRAKKLRWALGHHKRRSNPELDDIHLEDTRIEHALRRGLAKDANCVDIGAHIGSTLSLLLSICPEGRHWAFEPVAHKARWLRHKFPEVQIRELALSDAPGEVTFFEDTSEPGYSGLGQPVRRKNQVKQYRVRTALADDILDHNGPIHFIKIDVEGAELKTLEGARKTLLRHRPLVLFECTPEGLRRFALTPADIHAYVTEDLGYELRTALGHIHQGRALNRDEFISSQTYPFQGFNYFASPRQRTQIAVGAPQGQELPPVRSA